MFPTNLDAFKIYQKELHQRAAHYRLVKSLAALPGQIILCSNWPMLIITGQNLVKRTQAAH